MRGYSITCNRSGENWTPVINNKWKHNGGNKITTLFVDNLPDDSWSVWVRNLFSKFGRVRDLFIPNKRSKITGMRFGFVRFARRDEANMAIAKANGLWIWGNKLVVKLARFEADKGDLQGKYMNVSVNKKEWGVYNEFRKDEAFKGMNGVSAKENSGRYGEDWMGKQSRAKEVWRKKEVSISKSPLGKSYLEALKGNSWRKPKQPIQLKELGNEWLSRSVIAKLSPVRSMALVQDQLRSLGYADIQVRVMGGDSVILTFLSQETRESMFNGGQMAWLKDWFLETYKWEESTIKPSCCRLIWLNCYGLPIQLWNVHNFIKIGQYWGEVIQVSEDTMKDLSFAVGKVLVSTSIMEGINEVIEVECKGSIHRIRVMEEQLVVNTFLKTDCCCQGCLIKVSSSLNNKDNQMEENEAASFKESHKEDNGSLKKSISDMESYETSELNGRNKDNIPIDNLVMVANPVDLVDSVESVEVVEDSYEINGVQSRVEDSGKDNEIQVVGNIINEVLEPINNNCKQLVIAKSNSNTLGGLINSARETGRVDRNRKYPQLVMCHQLESSLRDNRVHIQKTLSNYISSNDSGWSLATFNRESLKTKEKATVITKEKEAAKPKRKQKTIEEILGIPRAGCFTKGGKKKKQKKSVMFRAAIADAALSVSSEGINNRNKILLNEAEAVLAVSKILGEDYSGDDEEVISKFMHMEDQNENRAAQLNDDLLIA